MKKEIIRKCAACRNSFNREELIKITKLKDGTLKINPTSKELGKSVYVCKNSECIKIFIKKKRLKASFASVSFDEILKTEEELKQNFI